RSFARVLREFVEQVGLRRPHLVGHDFGAAAVLGANLIENVEVSSLTIADGVVLSKFYEDVPARGHLIAARGNRARPSPTSRWGYPAYCSRFYLSGFWPVVQHHS